MAKPKRVNQNDVLKYGSAIARAKAGMSAKRWQGIVKFAQRHGHTVAGQLSGQPGPLMERTDSSLRKQARRTVADSYKPIMAELSRREAAAGFLEKKRADDEAAYRTWMSGEVGKLDAQARAADTTLQTQQSQIATDLNASQLAAKTDSLNRAAQAAGNVSDPNQSTALDQTAADTRSREHVANARQLTADMTKIGAGADEMSKAAVIATAAVAAATRTAEGWKTRSAISADRTAALAGQTKDTAGMLSDLRAGEVSKAQSNRESAQADATLGIKQDTLANTIAQANRNYRLENSKFKLEKWKAANSDTVARAKVQLGYDQIAEKHGQHAADQALKKWIEKFRAKKAQERQDSKGDGTKGVGKTERPLYRQVETVRGRIVQLHQKGVDPGKIRQRLRSEGWDDSMISLAEDLRVHGGVPSGAGRALAKKIGILHPGYFWAAAYETGVSNGSLAGPPRP